MNEADVKRGIVSSPNEQIKLDLEEHSWSFVYPSSTTLPKLESTSRPKRMRSHTNATRLCPRA